MTRDEQKKYKELTKALPKILKDKIKKYKFKKKDFMIWYNKQELFFDLFIYMRVQSDGKCYCTALEKIKPLWLDNLLWDFLNMESNKVEPLSLRAIGAFTVSGATLFEDKTELTEGTISELEGIIDRYLEHFYETIKSSSISNFYDNLETSTYHMELRKSLSFVYNHEYQEALEYLNDLGDGFFKNGDISVNNAIKEYCVDQLSKKTTIF